MYDSLYSISRVKQAVCAQLCGSYLTRNAKVDSSENRTSHTAGLPICGELAGDPATRQCLPTQVDRLRHEQSQRRLFLVAC